MSESNVRHDLASRLSRLRAKEARGEALTPAEKAERARLKSVLLASACAAAGPESRLAKA